MNNGFATPVPVANAQTVPLDINSILEAQRAIRAKRQARTDQQRQKAEENYTSLQEGLREIAKQQGDAYETHRQDLAAFSAKEEAHDELEDSYLKLLTDHVVGLASPSPSVSRSPASSCVPSRAPSRSASPAPDSTTDFFAQFDNTDTPRSPLCKDNNKDNNNGKDNTVLNGNNAAKQAKAAEAVDPNVVAPASVDPATENPNTIHRNTVRPNAANSPFANAAKTATMSTNGAVTLKAPPAGSTPTTGQPMVAKTPTKQKARRDPDHSPVEETKESCMPNASTVYALLVMSRGNDDNKGETALLPVASRMDQVIQVGDYVTCCRFGNKVQFFYTQKHKHVQPGGEKPTAEATTRGWFGSWFDFNRNRVENDSSDEDDIQECCYTRRLLRGR